MAYARPLLLSLALLPILLLAQNIGINANGATPNVSAMLDIDVSAITGTKRGLLIPRMTTVERNAITTPATSLLIFNTTTAQFEFFDGTQWRGLLSTATAGWGVTGNAGTNSATNFIGTTDAQDLNFRVNNSTAGKISVFGGGSGGHAWFGSSAGMNTSATAIMNTFIGFAAGNNNTFGSQNTFIGNGAGFANTTGSGNTLLGRSATTNGNPSNATAIGHQAQVNTSNSLVLGSVAGVNSATNTVNVGIGTNAPLDRLHVVGSIRMVDGNQAANKVLVSDANGTAGWQTLGATTTNAWSLTGNAGTNAATNFLGTTDAQPLRFRAGNVFAGNIPVLPTGNLAFGTSSGSSATGLFNTFLGNEAGASTTTGQFNTFVGYEAGTSNTSGSGNTYIGRWTGQLGTTGSFNTALGTMAGISLTTGQQNVLLGTSAGFQLTSAGNNVLVGTNAGNACNSSANTMVGTLAGHSTTIGSDNAFFGMNAGENNTTGTGNTFVGTTSGNLNFFGSDNTCLGHLSDVASGPFVNATALGAYAQVGQNNSLVLGSIAGTNGATADVNVGIGTTAPARSLHISRGASGGASNANAKLLLEDDATTYQHFLTPSTAESGLLFGTNAGSIRAAVLFNSSTSDGLDFRTGGNTVRAVLTNTGALGVGTTTPDQHVEVEGAGDQFLRVTSTSGVTGVVGIEFKRQGSGPSDWQVRNDGGLLFFGQSADELVSTTDVLRLGGGSVTPATDNTITCGQAALRWTNVFATSGVVNTSDAREKMNVRAIDRGLNDVLRLRPVRFQWKDRPEEGDKLGLIAQELQQVLPETVVDETWKVNEDGTREKVPAERLGVYYSDLIPVLIRAIQEQQQRIEALERTVQEQRNAHR